MLEMHFAVPMAGAVLNAINIRLDAKTIAVILKHSEAKVFLVDYEYVEIAKKALELLQADFERSKISEMLMPLVVVIDDINSPTGIRLGELEYEQLVFQGNPCYIPEEITEEWDPITMNYTSGTVEIYHHFV